MGDMYVARRANGDLFTEVIDERLLIPVWTSPEAVARYKERNPKLITYFPARLSRPLVRKIESGLGPGATPELFLLSEDAPDAYLNNGRPISLEEIFPDGETTRQPAHFQV